MDQNYRSTSERHLVKSSLCSLGSGIKAHGDEFPMNFEGVCAFFRNFFARRGRTSEKADKAKFAFWAFSEVGLML
jgi:hypothetical protein